MDDAEFLRSIGICDSGDQTVLESERLVASLDKIHGMVGDYKKTVLGLIQRKLGGEFPSAEKAAQRVAQRLVDVAGAQQQWTSYAVIPAPTDQDELDLLERALTTGHSVALKGGLRALVKGMSTGPVPSGLFFGRVRVVGVDERPTGRLYSLLITWDQEPRMEVQP
jgi:hypothetical protein